MADQWTEQARELAARRIERRKFLKGALGVSGLALLQGTPFARAVIPRSAAGLPSIPTNSGLDVFVITMMENRSVDHFLGWLPGIDGVQEGYSNPAALADPPTAKPAEGCPISGPLPVTDSTPVPTFHLEAHCQAPDPDHGWNGSRVEFNRDPSIVPSDPTTGTGLCNGFADRSGRVAMGYFKKADVPFLGWLAGNYNTFSRYFCSVMGPTFPNREYLFAAQAGGIKGNAIPVPTRENPMPTGYTWTTILDRLNAAGVPWAVYASDVPAVALFFHHIYESPGRVRHITDYFVDAAAGVLPNVVFIDPAFFTYGSDDHPAHDIKLGQRHMQDTFLALAEGPQWHQAAYILTYDEHGGFYDHVPPPRVSDERANANHCEDWGQLGFRVPTVLASPFSPRGGIGSAVYDHTSILKLIEWRFGLAPINMRDAAANNLGEILDFSLKRVELEEPRPFIPIHAAGVACAQNDVIEPLHGENPLEPVPDLPVPAPTRPGLPDPYYGEGASPHPELRALADSGVLGRMDMRERAKHGIWRD